MATIAKTVVATGVSSGLGLEAMKQLLEQAQPYRIILGARNTQQTQEAYDKISYDKSANSVAVLHSDLSDMKDVKTFARQALEKLGQDKLDYLLLNAGMASNASQPGPNGSKWCEPYIVNHLSQFYLVHLLREKLVASKSRIVFVSSGAIRGIKDPATLDTELKGGSGAADMATYSNTKFAQLLGAHWWRRQLAGSCHVVAVSPGLIPGTGLGRHSGVTLTMDMPDAKPVPVGAASILAAFTRDDFPENPDQIFLTSWGEWWGPDVLEKSLDKDLQDKWSPSKEQIEKEEGIPA